MDQTLHQKWAKYPTKYLLALLGPPDQKIVIQFGDF